MNIQFKNIFIENFRSIEKAEVNLSQQGIVIVKGINEYEDKATSNGSGKSSIFEAIVFALFEETSNGDKDVANRILCMGYTLILNFNIDNVEYKIIRKNDGKKSEVKLLKSNEDISARNKTDTNKLIIQLLGINKNLFLDSIFLSQESNTNLASLQPTARKERLEILTNTDNVVNTFKEQLKEKQAEYEAKCINWDKETYKIKGNLNTLEDQVEHYKQKINEIDKQIAYRNSLGNLDELEKKENELLKIIDDLRKESITLTRNITLKQNEIDEYNNNGKNLLENKNEIIQDLNVEKTKLNKIKTEIDKNTYTIKHDEEDIKRYNLEIEKILKSDTCPTCGRKYENVNEEHINKTIDEYKDSINNIQNNINVQQLLNVNLNKELNKQEDIIAEIENKLQLVENQIIEYNKNGNNLLIEKSNIQTEINNLNKQIDQNTNDLNKCRSLKDTILKIQIGNKQEFQDLLDESNQQLVLLNEKQKELTEKYDVDNNYVGTIKHCQQLVTKDFRTYLLKNSVNYLNNLLQQYSNELFSNSKDVIYITNDDNKLDIKLGNATYESLSGGEKTRVNIALLLAQKSLANSIGNINCNLIILDEILGYCDSMAESNIINLITKELNSLESIYMVSHKEIPIGYDSQLIIRKNKDGLSSVVLN